jgi:hypothetical protein
MVVVETWRPSLPLTGQRCFFGKDSLLQLLEQQFDMVHFFMALLLKGGGGNGV